MEARSLAVWAGTASLVACRLVPVVVGQSLVVACGLEPAMDQLSSAAWSDMASWGLVVACVPGPKEGAQLLGAACKQELGVDASLVV